MHEEHTEIHSNVTKKCLQKSYTKNHLTTNMLEILHKGFYIIFHLENIDFDLIEHLPSHLGLAPSAPD